MSGEERAAQTLIEIWGLCAETALNDVPRGEVSCADRAAIRVAFITLQELTSPAARVIVVAALARAEAACNT